MRSKYNWCSREFVALPLDHLLITTDPRTRSRYERTSLFRQSRNVSTGRKASRNSCLACTKFCSESREFSVASRRGRPHNRVCRTPRLCGKETLARFLVRRKEGGTRRACRVRKGEREKELPGPVFSDNKRVRVCWRARESRSIRETNICRG